MKKNRSELDDYLDKHLFKLGTIGGYKGMMYHYTSSNGFNSILFNNDNKITFWASRYDCLNDMSEGVIALELYKKVVNIILEEGKISKDLYELFINIKAPKTKILYSYERGTMRGKRLEYDSYICSFSKNNDSLAMWNYYSKGNMYEGFNIGLDSDEIFDDFHMNKQDYTECKISNVFYGEVEQVNHIRNVLEDIVKLYRKEDEMYIRFVISYHLEEWSMIFKSEYFKHEQEVRLIFSVPKKEEYRSLKIKYRNSCGYTIPYVEIKLNKDLFIKTTIGPLMCSEEQKNIQKEILQDRLFDAGLERATTNYSRIPVRY